MNTIKGNVHLIATDKGSTLGLSNCNRLYNFPQGAVHHEAQHLYITTDEEIKEGDWVLSTFDKWAGTNKQLLPELGKIISITDSAYLIDSFNGDTNNRWNKGHSRKIVATTNKNLWCNGLKRDGASCSKNNLCTFPTCDGAIAKIDTQYIEEYIKLFNEGKAPKTVWLEKEECQTTKQEDYQYFDNHKSNLNYVQVLKLKPDGSVIVIKEEQSFKDKMFLAYSEGCRIASPFGDQSLSKTEKANWEIWFDKNYPNT